MSGDAPPPPSGDPVPEKASGAELVYAVFNEIGILDQLAGARLERALPRGMRMSHFGVLNHFARLGGEQTPAQLADAFQVSRAAMTNTLQRLEAAGWIALRPDPADGRGKRVWLTAEGRAARDGAIAALAPELAGVAERMGEDALRAALPVLREMRRMLDSER